MKKFIQNCSLAITTGTFALLTVKHLNDGDYGAAFLSGAVVFVLMLWAATDDIVKAIKESKKP